MARHGQDCKFGSSCVKSASGLGHRTTFDNQGRDDRVAGGFTLERSIPVDYNPAFGNERMKKKSSSVRRRRTLAQVASPATSGMPVNVSFPVVGIGASAGGLEALEHFLSRVPENSGMAFVIVQHLDPTRKGIMPELLQRTTSMNVIQVKDRTKGSCINNFR
jgi:hypothetical protein